MDPDQRALTLSLLPHMERPPDIGVEEWTELLILEAPSILGVTLPRAVALECSEPTFPSESGESEEPVPVSLSDSLAGYSPSPAGYPIERGVQLADS